MSDVFWKLSEAIAWIADRSDEAVEEAPGTVIYLLLADGEKSQVPEAKAALWTALMKGEIAATGIAGNGARVEIPNVRWHDLQPCLHGKTETMQTTPQEPGEFFTEVIVAIDDVRQKWPARNTPVVASRPEKLPDKVASIIEAEWPDGMPQGMKVKEFENAIVALVKKQIGTTISTRTAKRARQRAK